MPVPTTYDLAVAAGAGPAVQHGVDLLTAAFADSRLTLRPGAALGEQIERPRDEGSILVVVGTRSGAAIAELERQEWLLYTDGAPGANGYCITMLPGRVVVVTGADDGGVLYGCQELARVVREQGRIPWDLDRGETPDLALRGPAIGLQLTEVEPPRQVYEYPVTPDRFPWFYDRGLWLEMLDTLLEQRANVIYLWSGHPFASFVQLPEFPEALEVTDAELAANREVLAWLVDEAGRRGVQLFLMFYNIHIPLPFAEHHQIPLHQPRPTELVSRYTTATLEAFVADFPQVGLYVCLGEVLQGDLYGVEWFTETILPGVEAGLERAGGAPPPPILLRAHSLDPQPVIEATGDRYPALHTEAKYNGESLTTWTPRGKWQDTHRYLASLGGTHVVNIHILADLEPFRYGAVTFIRRSVAAIRHRLGGRGLHLYPLFYWEWPYSPDRAEPRLRQLDRDWLWFAAWHRYAWKSDRDPAAEQDYWTHRLAAQFGTEAAGAAALQTYESMGQVAPRLVRRLGITEGNRQTLSLGMTLGQLTNPGRYRAFADLWESHAPAGERLEQFVETEAAGRAHIGETPLDVVAEGRHFAAKAVAAVEAGRPAVTTGSAEYERLATDAQATAMIADFYDLRVRAAVEILRARTEHQGHYPDLLPRLRTAIELVEKSVAVYRELAALTTGTYRYANSMQTPQRKIPFPNGKEFGHWQQCLPQFQAELEHLRANAALLERGELPPAVVQRSRRREQFREIELTLHSAEAERFTVATGTDLFTGGAGTVRACAAELAGLTGVRLDKSAGVQGVLDVDFSLAEPGHLLVGYFKATHPEWLQVPDLETNTHADDRGGLAPVLTSALTVDWHPDVDVHAFRYEAGRHLFSPGGGAYVILGVVAADQEFTGRSVRAADEGADTFDWLYDDPRPVSSRSGR